MRFAFHPQTGRLVLGIQARTRWFVRGRSPSPALRRSPWRQGPGYEHAAVVREPTDAVERTRSNASRSSGSERKNPQLAFLAKAARKGYSEFRSVWRELKI